MINGWPSLRVRDPVLWTPWPILVLLSGMAFAQPQARDLPLTHVRFLDGQEMVLPQGLIGKPAVLILGFSRSSSAETLSWVRQVEQDFAGEQSPRVCRLAFLEEVPALFRGIATRDIQKNSHGSDLNTTALAYEQEAAWKGLVGYSNADDAYVVVIDQRGMVVAQAHGLVGTSYSGISTTLHHILQTNAGRQPQ